MPDLIDLDRRRLLGLGALGLAGARLGLYNPLMQPTTSTPGQLAGEGQLASLRTATAWLNSPPLTADGLRGKVVLIDIWTYTCINWLRTLPYVRAWAEKYKAQGLVVIGVHCPEFPFEHDLENVRREAKAMGVRLRDRECRMRRKDAANLILLLWCCATSSKSLDRCSGSNIAASRAGHAGCERSFVPRRARRRVAFAARDGACGTCR